MGITKAKTHNEKLASFHWIGTYIQSQNILLRDNKKDDLSNRDKNEIEKLTSMKLLLDTFLETPVKEKDIDNIDNFKINKNIILIEPLKPDKREKKIEKMLALKPISIIPLPPDQ